MTEQNLHDYNKWLMEVWNPNQLYIPFAIDAPKAFLDYQAKQLIIADVVKSDSEQLVLFADWLQYNGKWSLPEQQAKDFLKEQKEQN